MLTSKLLRLALAATTTVLCGVAINATIKPPTTESTPVAEAGPPSTQAGIVVAETRPWQLAPVEETQAEPGTGERPQNSQPQKTEAAATPASTPTSTPGTAPTSESETTSSNPTVDPTTAKSNETPRPGGTRPQTPADTRPGATTTTQPQTTTTTKASTTTTVKRTTTTQKPTTTTTKAPTTTTTKAPTTTTTTTTTTKPPATTLPAGAVYVTAGASIQQAVNNNPTGTTFILGAGIHKRQSVTPKTGQKFIGENGAILDGEKATTRAFGGSSSNVTIENLTIKNYTNPAETGAVQGGSSWTVKNNEIAYNKGAGIHAYGGWHVVGNNVHHNGQIGILAHGANITIRSNTIAYNNTDGWDSHWEAGGTKFYGQVTKNLTVKNNIVHHNDGPGLWTDYVGDGTLYEGNHSYDNAGPGIFHEISGSAIIRNNTTERNGDGPDYKAWVEGAGILINSSRDVTIQNNTVKNNNDGIGLVESGRTPGLRNITVKNNTINLRAGSLNGGVAVKDDVAPQMTGWNIVFSGNTYTGGGAKNFAWKGKYISWSEWQTAGQDTDGKFN